MYIYIYVIICMQTFDKYDRDRNGALEFDDLKALLTDLNQGVLPYIFAYLSSINIC